MRAGIPWVASSGFTIDTVTAAAPEARYAFEVPDTAAAVVHGARGAIGNVVYVNDSADGTVQTQYKSPALGPTRPVVLKNTIGAPMVKLWGCVVVITFPVSGVMVAGTGRAPRLSVTAPAPGVPDGVASVHAVGHVNEIAYVNVIVDGVEHT